VVDVGRDAREIEGFGVWRLVVDIVGLTDDIGVMVGVGWDACEIGHFGFWQLVFGLGVNIVGIDTSV